MAVFENNQVDLPTDKDELEEVHDSLAENVIECFQKAKRYRSSIMIQGKSVEDWFVRLNDAYHKTHAPEELAKRPNMRSYYGLTQIKVNMVGSYLRSKYANPTNPPFNIQPTPIVSCRKTSNRKGLRE